MLGMTQAAERAGVSRRTIWRYVRDGRLPSVLQGQRRLVDAAAVDQRFALHRDLADILITRWARYLARMRPAPLAVTLFGSAARHEPAPHDIDVLMVVPAGQHNHPDYHRVYHALWTQAAAVSDLPANILVIDTDELARGAYGAAEMLLVDIVRDGIDCGPHTLTELLRNVLKATSPGSAA